MVYGTKISQKYDHEDLIFLFKQKNINFTFPNIIILDLKFHLLPLVLFELIEETQDKISSDYFLDLLYEYIKFDRRINKTIIINISRKVAMELLKKQTNNDNTNLYIQSLRYEIDMTKTFVEYIWGKGNQSLELHANSSEEIYHNEDIIHLVRIEDVSATNIYEDGVNWEQHGGVGYHFHYCKRKDKNLFERTRYLLSYNTVNRQHIGKNPELFAELHREGTSKAGLPKSQKNKWAIYHRCNSVRLRLLDKDFNVKFRCKSVDAELFYR